MVKLVTFKQLFHGYWFLIGALVLTSFFVFTRLDDSYLWRDEAHVALIAKNILVHGYPLAWDDNNVFYQHPKDINAAGVWTIHTWLQNYIMATSFFFLGISTFTARLPFALFGLASVAVLYFFLEIFFKDRILTRIVVVLYITSVPVLLYMRQGFYPILVLFFTLTTAYTYLLVIRGARHSTFWFGSSMVLLFHSMYHAYASVIISIFMYTIFWTFHRKRLTVLKNVAVGFLCSLIFIIPWIVYADVFKRKSAFAASHFFTIVITYVHYIGRYLIPIVLIIILLIVYGIISVFKKRKPFHGARIPEHTFSLNNDPLWFISLLSVVIVVFHAFIPAAFPRYIIGSFPLIFILVGFLFRRLSSLHVSFLRYITFACLVLVIFTNVFHYPSVFSSSYSFHSYLTDFFYELTHAYVDMVEGVSEYLIQHGSSNDSVIIFCGALPVIFYTHMHFGFVEGAPPTWIIPRLEQKIIVSGYEQINLSVPYSYLDTSRAGECENDPDMGRHQFRTMSNRPYVTLYKRIKPMNDSSFYILTTRGPWKIG